MERALTPDEIVAILRRTPEQAVFDWKRDFVPPTDDDKAGELTKDISAVANATAFSHETGYIFYGVDPGRSDPLVGVTERWDDARLQQLVRAKTAPPVEFLYYAVPVDDAREVAVVAVPRSRQPFHVISREVGRLREGQILIRDGSTTRGIRREDLTRLYLEVGHGYAEKLLAKYNMLARLLTAQAQQQAVNNQTQQQLLRQMEAFSVLPRGFLGA